MMLHFFSSSVPALRRLLPALACACLWASGPAVLPAHAAPAVNLPSMGDGADLTTSEERQLGNRIIRSLYRDPDYLDDAPLHAYVQSIWLPLVQATKARGDMSPELEERFAWEILLGRDKSINAFALPGGYLGVHLGLIGAVSTSDELATVMAHELTHVTQRHIARMVGQEKRSAPLMIASLVLGALAASQSPDAANALILGGQAAAIQNQLGFSRDMEREADRIGYSLLAPAGFAPQGAVSMFDKLQQASRLNDNGSWPYLRSHPLTTERIADMQARAPQGQPPVPTMEHVLMAARARVLTRPGIDVLRQWASLPTQSGFAQGSAQQQAAQRYAAVMAWQQQRQWSQAQAQWDALYAQMQQQGDAAALRQVRWLGAELALAQQQPQQALALLAADASDPTVRRPALLLRAQALLDSGQAAAVSDSLQTWVLDHPQDAAAWRLLGQAWQAQGQQLRSIRAEAEAHAAHYDYAAAVDRLKAGQDAARRTHSPQDYMDASIIDTRLRAIEALRRQQLAEK